MIMYMCSYLKSIQQHKINISFSLSKLNKDLHKHYINKKIVLGKWKLDKLKHNFFSKYNILMSMLKHK